jgi:hypothetical protein
MTNAELFDSAGFIALIVLVGILGIDLPRRRPGIRLFAQNSEAETVLVRELTARVSPKNMPNGASIEIAPAMVAVIISSVS